MEVRGDHLFATDRQTTWAMLLDPEVLRSVLPGCEEFREVSSEHYRVTLTLNLIAFSASVGGDVAMTDRDPPNSYQVRVSGSGSAGSLDVNGTLALADEGPGTRVAYDLDIQLDGTLAMLGATVVEPAAKMIMGQFLGAMDRAIAARAAGTKPPA
jgi:carbon monoxide dehydrogenase subunit G